MRRALLLALALFCLSAPALAQGTTNYPPAIDDLSTLPQAVDKKFTYLTAAVTSGATAIPVNSTAGLPSTVIAEIDSELLSCAVTNATTLTCSRGFSGTAAAPHAIRATVRFPIAAAHINGTRGAAEELEKKVGPGASPAAAASTGQVLKKNADGTTGWGADATGGGEANTASNVGTAGVGVFKTKSGVDLQFKKLNAGSPKVTVSDDTAHDEVDLDVVEANLSRNSLGGGALTIPNGGTNATTASGARTSLGAAASGSNSDITSLTASGLQISSLAAVTLAESTPATLTANVNNYALATAVVQRLSSDASRAITGISTNSQGRYLLLVNVGSFDVVLSNESASSTAAFRIITGTGAGLTVAPNGRVWLWYDSTSQRWRVI